MRSLLIAIFSIVPATAFAQPGTGWHGPMGSMPFGGFGMIVLIVVIGFIFVLMIRGSTSRNKDKTPLDILKERYARGEIDHDEYEEIRKRLDE
ncbi:SHOCT domain-containing protein [Salidesulfovibrio brasiliensis]